MFMQNSVQSGVDIDVVWGGQVRWHLASNAARVGHDWRAALVLERDKL